MLVEFSVGNFWSFKEIQTFHLQAAKIKSKFAALDVRNVFTINEQLSLLKSKAVYGANGSGKSNLIRALVSMLSIVRDCLQNSDILRQMIVSFQLQEELTHQASFFQLTFCLENMQYRYGFEATRESILSEWLFGKPLQVEAGEPKPRERYYFTREGRDIQVNETHFKEGVRFAKADEETPPLFRENTLFLAVVAAFNGPVSRRITQYFKEDISIISGLGDTRLREHALNRLNEESYKEKVTKLLQAIDPTIHHLEPVELNVSQEIPEEATPLKQKEKKAGGVLIVRHVYNEAGKKIGFAPLLLHLQEAEGTKKLFELSATIFSVLEKGAVLFIDEFDARMHPKLTRKIVGLFHSETTNPHHAQFVFVTHDSNLLDAKLLRRDQIAFVKKDRTGASSIYSLVEFKGVRNNASFEKEYLLGKYGAVPSNLNAFEEAIGNYLKDAKGE